MSSAHSRSNVVISHVQALLKACGVDSPILTEDWHAVAGSKMPDPASFADAKSFAHAYLQRNVLRKYADFDLGLNTKQAATDGFTKSEVGCYEVNRSIGALPYVPGVHLVRQQQSIVESAKDIIKQCLGKFDFAEFEASCDFSNGSSTRCRSNSCTPFDKVAGKPHVTLNCRDLAVHYIWCNPLWRCHYQGVYGRESDPYTWVQLVPGSRFSTVPKDSCTDRPICVEPDLNMFFQKGIGTMIRRRLRRNRINLNDQTLNQALALKGSIDNSLATIDLRSASDSISLEVVRMLLPQQWYELLLTTRSPYVLLNGKYRKLEKISSMGNGFTFELESLIFWALSKAVLKVHGLPSTHLSVYGDDIVIPSAASASLISVLTSLGFETNTTKTFVAGPFRESCGKHYFLGADVSPFFVKGPIVTHSDIYHYCNSLQEWLWLDEDHRDTLVAEALRPIMPRQRCYVPPHFGSRSGLRCGVHRSRGFCRKRQAWKFQFLREVRTEHRFNGPVAYLTAMLLGEQREPSDFSSTLKGQTRSLLTVGFTSVWCDA